MTNKLVFKTNVEHTARWWMDACKNPLFMQWVDLQAEHITIYDVEHYQTEG